MKKLILLLPGMMLSVLPLKAEPFAVLDSLSGKVEMRKAGHEKWIIIGTGARLYNNDIVRALKNSHARIHWNDGRKLYLHQNTQILVNTFENEKRKTITQHITVFKGAVFFLVKSILPQQIVRGHDTKVYTPTAVVAVRGTSFEVKVNEADGLSSVAVINGTVLVRNILKNISSFLSAGFKTQVAVNTDPILPKAILDKEINYLKTWVPSGIVDTEMKEQKKKARRDYTVITGKTTNKLIVMPLMNNSHYEGTWDVGKELAGEIVQRIPKVVNGFKTEIPAKPQADPLIYGVKEHAKYVLTGTIENFEINNLAKISTAADEYSEHNIAHVRLHLQLIDITGQKLIYDNYFTGEVSGRHNSRNSWKSIAKLKFDLKNKEFAGSIIGLAVQKVLQQSVDDVARYIHLD
ncbi:MAG: hypothetical protein GF398_07675 [Chitinivibrionales bacterium]|nr:hypothetical protein [Chitinivibrionales bacterium]